MCHAISCPWPAGPVKKRPILTVGCVVGLGAAAFVLWSCLWLASTALHNTVAQGGAYAGPAMRFYYWLRGV